MRNPRWLFSGLGLFSLLAGVGLIAGFRMIANREQAQGGRFVAARSVMRGERIPRIDQCRERPIDVAAKRYLTNAVSEEELVAVLCGALPLWNPPSVPSAFHELRLWGRKCAFTKEMLGAERTGEFLVTTLLNDDACVANTASPGGNYLLDSPLGIRVVQAGTLDAVEFRAEGHYGQLLKVMGLVGVPSTTSVSTSSGRVGTIADLYQDAVMRFSLHQELEFIGCALAYWHPPRKTWNDQFGNEYNFDHLLKSLMATPFGKGACGGGHVAYAVVTILRVDEQYPILSAGMRPQARAWLGALSQWLEAREAPEGGWDKSWAQPGVLRFVYGDDLLDRITITGHHLEWMALVPSDDLRPAEAVIKRAVAALRRDVESLPPIEHRSFKTMLPVSHGARALALFRGDDPFAVWVKYWKAGRLERTERGFALRKSSP
jgi:hypothetical protein